jgi:hypothetical protein
MILPQRLKGGHEARPDVPPPSHAGGGCAATPSPSGGHRRRWHSRCAWVHWWIEPLRSSRVDEPKGRDVIFYAATGLFVANFALGLLVQFGIVDTKPFRWFHHVLFFAVCASAALAVAEGFWRGAPYRWTLLPVLALYAVLPRVRAGTAGHAALACGALVLYAAGFVFSR